MPESRDLKLEWDRREGNPPMYTLYYNGENVGYLKLPDEIAGKWLPLFNELSNIKPLP